MRMTNRDWIAWSVAAAILVVGSFYYFETMQPAPDTHIYRITVTPDRG